MGAGTWPMFMLFSVLTISEAVSFRRRSRVWHKMEKDFAIPKLGRFGMVLVPVKHGYKNNMSQVPTKSK